jgi:catechol 2,3-dioxygenase-like lactoylglutathione lyase family enzyme
MSSFHITGFDHLVLRCADVDSTLAWYVDTLGLAQVRVDEWRSGVAPFPSVRVSAETIIDLVPATGVVTAQ